MFHIQKRTNKQQGVNMVKQYGSHRIYKQELNFLNDTRDIKYKLNTNILVQGDSWFDYPGRNANFMKGPSNLFDALLETISLGCNWFDTAVIGATTEQILKETDLLKLFKARHTKLDLYLLSAGGNDIFEGLEIMLNNYIDVPNPDENLSLCFNDGLSIALSNIVNFYSEVIANRDLYFPKLPILAHDYAPPTARVRPFALFKRYIKGPWVNKALTNKGYPAKTDSNLRNRLIRYLHSQLTETLQALFRKHEKCHLYSATLRGIDLGSKVYWDDEIHLTPKGNRVIAKDMLVFMKDEGIYPSRK